MNPLQHEQLFTDLPPEQAETVTAGRIGTSVAVARYGRADAAFTEVNSNGSFIVQDLHVTDTQGNNRSVYARFQGLRTDGSLTKFTKTARFDKNGSYPGSGEYRNLSANLGPNIQAVRVLVFQQDAERDSETAGDWSFV